MKTKLVYLLPVLCIIGVWMAFSSPYFLHNLVPYPSKYQVSFFSPWNADQQYWGPVKNNAMPDIIDQIYPWKHFTVEWLKKGVIPLWNPNNFAGNPHLANFQTAVLSPFNVLYFILPFIDAWSVIILLQPLLSGLGMYLFLRQLRVTPPACVLGAITFMFCGFSVVWMEYGTLGMAIALLPLALWGIEKGFAKNKYYFAIMVLAIVISFFSGHFQTSLYFVLYLLGYILFKFLQTRNKSVTIWALIFFFSSIILSLPQVYPTMMFYQNSVRSGLAYKSGGIPADYLITAVAPDFYGNPVTRNDWRGSYAEWASFIGMIPLLFALLAICSAVLAKFRPSSFKSPSGTYISFFAIAGLVGLVFALETPLHGLLIASHLPIFSTSIPSRLIVVFSFSFAVLAAFGMSEMTVKTKRDSFTRLLPVLIGIAVWLGMLLVAINFFHTIPADKARLAMKNLILPVLLFLIAGTFLMAEIFLKNKRVSMMIAIILFCLATVDSYRFATKWMPFEPKSLVFPDMKVITAMQKAIGYGRVYGNLGAQVETYYGLPSLEGYDPLYIQRYGEFIHYADDGKFKPAERSVVVLNRRAKYGERVLDLLGVNLIYHPLADTGQSWAFPVWKDYAKYSVIYQDDKFQLYRNNTAMPRVSLFYHYEIINNDKKILSRFYSQDFDFRKTLILEQTAGAVDTIANGSVKIVSYTPNRVVVTAKSTGAGLLFLSDPVYPNWQVTVNGTAQTIYRADYAFRAVKVEKGTSQVVFEYK